MFDVLIESKHRHNKKRLISSGVLSLFVHVLIIGAAVVATYGASQAGQGPVIDTTVVFLQEQTEQKPPEPQLQNIELPKGFQTVVAPMEIPTDIPPVNLQEHFDPRDYTGEGVEGGIGTGFVVGSDQVFMEAVVEEKPERLTGPAPQYPPFLQQAGIEGTVMLEAIIDTTGRVIPTSVKIVSSPNPGFNAAARETVVKSLFRPARVHGRPVKVLIRIPIQFRLTRR
ncbi:MAG: energy transducer TonB [Gemmatimonadales bacterium]